MAKGWYILQVYSNYEKKVKESIGRLVSEPFLSEAILNVYIPEESVVEMGMDGQRKTVKRKFLPGYLLVEMDMPEDDTSWKGVLNRVLGVQGVTGFLGAVDRYSKPSPISSDEARAILEKMGEFKTTELVVKNVNLDLGEHVRIAEGAFQNFTGVVEDILHEKGKVKVRVEMFGRSTLVEMDYVQVEKI